MGSTLPTDVATAPGPNRGGKARGRVGPPIVSARERWRGLTAAEVADRNVTVLDLRPTDEHPTDERSTDDLGPATAVAAGPTVPVDGPDDRLDPCALPDADAQRWQRRYVLAIAGLDGLAMVVAGLVTLLVMNSWGDVLRGVPYWVICCGAVPVWLVVVAIGRGYEHRHLGLGSEEFRRVANAGIRFLALAAIVAFVTKVEVARSLVGVGVPVTTTFALGLRYVARQLLHLARARGRACHRVIVVGEGPQAEELVARLDGAPHSGLRVVGTFWPGDGRADQVAREVLRLGADSVAVAHSPGVTPEVLRLLSWSLEGSGVQLLVAPAFTDVAGPRINVRPVSGLPLLQIAEPTFTGARRIAKNTFDRATALVLVLLALPLLVLVAVAVRVSSPGPVVFRQTRIGREGRPFTMLKFRSMYPDAEARRAEVEALNELDGVLFKARNDPRITPLGRYLRRFSLDELPQLLNVLSGSMSLVGPRPPLPSEVAQYERDASRRLLVTPGLTGLWQVSVRSNLSWDESVRLDLYYVENWSVALDTEILWKTAFAVLRGAGAR